MLASTLGGVLVVFRVSAMQKSFIAHFFPFFFSVFSLSFPKSVLFIILIWEILI